MGPENSGAGGSGRLGLPPYWLEGVPGLGEPLRSAGSNWRFTGGGLPKSTEARDGDHERVGEMRPLCEYGTYDVSGTSGGAESMMDGARECECDDRTLGW